jgi:RND family efflux transporter MFP subunit
MITLAASSLTSAAIAAGLLALGSPPATDAGFPAVTRPLHDLRLAFPTSGRIDSIAVRLGERVTAGALLATLDDADLAAEEGLLRLRAGSAVEVEAALMAFELADDRLCRIREAGDGGGATPIEINDAQREASRLQKELELAHQRRREAACELARVEALRSKQRLVAPFDGVVEELVLEAGGAVDELAPLLRVVDERVLRVEVAVPVEHTLQLRPGQAITVWYAPELGAAPQRAVVTAVAAVADAASRTRLIHAEMPNATGLPAGLPVRVGLADPGPGAITRGADD